MALENLPSSSRKGVSPIRVAIVGTGGMGHAHARSFQSIPHCKLVAACDIHAAHLAAFAEKYGIPETYATVEEMLQKSRVDAVSVVTPDAMHAPVSIACLKAGKHVLCEKPLAVDYPEARKMVAAAKKAGTVNMVNFTYRNHPPIHVMAEMVQKGKIGRILHVEASYLQSWLVGNAWGEWRISPTWLWRLSSRHGSKGALGDIGVHIIDFATYPAGPIKKVYCSLLNYRKAPRNRIGEYVLDANDAATMNVVFANGATGCIQTSRFTGGHLNRIFLRLVGEKGTLEFDSEHSTDHFRICTGPDLNRNLFKEVKARKVPNNHARFIQAIRTGQPFKPDFARGAEVQKVLDRSFASAEADRPLMV